MSDHETKETDDTPVTKEEEYADLLAGVDFWDDLPVLIRVMEEKYSQR